MINTDGNILDKLTDSEYFLLSILVNYGKKSHPKNDVLLSRTKWGMQKLQAVKKELISKGFLIVNSRTDREKGGKGSNEYIVNTKLLAKYNGNQLHEFHVIEIQLDEKRVHEIQLDENRVIENRVHENHTIYKVLKVSIIETLKELLKNEIIESGGKKEPTHQDILEIDILKKQNETLLLEIEALKAEKEKEKKVAAKKEKESNEPPPHKTDLNQAKNKAMWEFEILENEMWLKTEKSVQAAFLEYCICHQEIEGRSLPTRSVFANLELVQKFLTTNPPVIVAECLKLAVLNRNKTFDPKFVTNRKNGAFKSTKEKLLHNNDLVMKSESLNHLNKWNKAK